MNRMKKELMYTTDCPADTTTHVSESDFLKSLYKVLNEFFVFLILQVKKMKIYPIHFLENFGITTGEFTFDYGRNSYGYCPRNFNLSYFKIHR